MASNSQKTELDEYLEWTSSGKWYEKLQKIYDVSRDEAKTIWMEIAYSKNSSFKIRKRKFAKEFPFISEFIENLKMDNHHVIIVIHRCQ
jgi:hypothetical protein